MVSEEITKEPSDDEIYQKLNEEQLKYCDSVLKALKKHRDAGPFLVPVNPIALGIPDYPMIIKNPMDLSTIEKKLIISKEYQNAEQFAADVRLMLNNCYSYNPPETIVYKRGKNLEKQLDNLLKKMPTKETILTGMQSALVSSGIAAADKKRKGSTTALAGSGTFSAPGAKKRATDSPGGETPKPRRVSSMKQGPRSSDELKQCLNVWKEITKRTNLVWPFLQPVDPVALGIPDYFTIIKEPMDFGTIKKKIDAGNYGSFSEFERDVRLIFSNCYTYNAPNSDVVSFCKQIESIFESKITSMLPKSKSFVGHEESGDESGEDSDSEKMKVLKQQLSHIKSQIAAIVQKRKSRKVSSTPSGISHPSAGATGLAHSGKVQKLEKTPGLPKKEKKHAVLDEVTFQEKKKLSEDISTLSAEQLNGVVEIIQEFLPTNRNGSEEIELDMDILDTKTIRKLQAFIQNHQAKLIAKPQHQHPIVSSSSDESDSD